VRFAHRVRTIWSWLPAFRAVAETQHLPSAAHELGIVPSSLSRTVKHLEDELGVALFERTSKALVLNEAGRIVAAAVREAMRIIDDALGRAVGDELRGAVGAVATSDVAHAVVMPAVAALADSSPALALAIRTAHPAEMVDMLRRGEVDVAIMFESPAHDDLQAVELATWTRSAFARSADVAGALRCVVVGTAGDHLHDGWPPGVERVIAAWAPDERSALELCVRGGLATIAFDAVAQASGLADRLVRLPIPELPPRTLYLVHRRAIGRHVRTEALVEALARAGRG
jgi:DNA-binding transcriptional LysR family regulator